MNRRKQPKRDVVKSELRSHPGGATSRDLSAASHSSIPELQLADFGFFGVI